MFNFYHPFAPVAAKIIDVEECHTFTGGWTARDFLDSYPFGPLSLALDDYFA